jgi:hypothetical protein
MRGSIIPACRPAAAAISAILALAAAGCGATGPSGLRFVSAKARPDPGYYAVTAVIENAAPEPVSLDSLEVDMTTYDGEGKVIAKGYRFSFRGDRGDIAPFTSTRLPLNRPDRSGQVRTSRLYLRDGRGRIVSEIEVAPPIEETAEEPPPDDFRNLTGRP